METAASILLAKKETSESAHFVVLKGDVDPPGQSAILLKAGTLICSTKTGRADTIVIGGRSKFATCLGVRLQSSCKIQHVSLSLLGNGLKSSEVDGLVGGLQGFRDNLTKACSGPGRICVILECLTLLLILYPVTEVLKLIDCLRSNNVIGIIGNLYTDVLPEGVVHALEREAKAQLVLTAPYQGMQSLGFPTHTRVDGTLVLHEKRRTGRVSIKRQWYQLQGNDEIVLINELEDPEIQPLKLPILPESSVSHKPLQPTVGMRHSLNAQETAARGSVALPHTKVTDTGLSRDAEDHQSSGALGQIHYVRDSESEYDSDEDPDNDLDI